MDEYNRILDELNTDYIADSIIQRYYGKPLDEIYARIQEAYIEHTSYNWFSGDIVLLYPSFQERKAAKPYNSIHNAYIAKGQTYINYNALLVDKTRNTKYVLRRSLKFELSYELPHTIIELEDLERNTGNEITIKKVLSKNKRRTI
jgi:hypothetical protein